MCILFLVCNGVNLWKSKSRAFQRCADRHLGPKTCFARTHYFFHKNKWCHQWPHSSQAVTSLTAIRAWEGAKMVLQSDQCLCRIVALIALLISYQGLHQSLGYMPCFKNLNQSVGVDCISDRCLFQGAFRPKLSQNCSFLSENAIPRLWSLRLGWFLAINEAEIKL